MSSKYRVYSWWNFKGFGKDKQKHGRKFISGVKGFLKKLSHKKLRHFNKKKISDGESEVCMNNYSETGHLEPRF